MYISIEKNLKGQNGNYILPFFWQHGEEEAVLREYMKVIEESGAKAVCVESRPHPDFCGPKWWQDMDIILKEAKNRNMKVWILDDSHFPTGFANGAMEQQPIGLRRRGICYKSVTVTGDGGVQKFSVDKFLKSKNRKMTLMNVMASASRKKQTYPKDEILAVTANSLDDKRKEPIDLTGHIRDGKIGWQVPQGKWQICMTKISFDCGSHPNYINMTIPESCKVLIDTVYEPHWNHYKDEFGKTIAGFFSDEPELGNGSAYSHNKLGYDQDLPWSDEVAKALEQRLGEQWSEKLPYLWENNMDAAKTANIRYIYMDVLTNAVQHSFSQQIGDWCREHGVEYIGHVIEDANGHARTGGALGHYFRGLWGQDMAGIDDIGGQVMPQGEDGPNKFMKILERDGEFYHYTLGRLGPSLASLDAKKQGRTMCEIFGNYGWSEGLRLERYLADHFMVNGINYYVPHAFSAKAFPDPDCPPHFYAHGHNPQYKHFRYLMDYMNRICELISEGVHISPISVLYHAEAEWTGEAMLDQKVLRVLLDAQLNADLIPVDAFIDREAYHTNLTNGFQINTQEYRALVIPYSQFVGTALVNAIKELRQAQIPVIFIDDFPKGLYDDPSADIKEHLKGCELLKLNELTTWLYEQSICEIKLSIASDRLRYLHYRKESESLFYFVNEGTQVYEGQVTIPLTGNAYAYNAWDNRLERVLTQQQGANTLVSIRLEPLQSLLIVFGELSDTAGDLATPLNQLTVPGNGKRKMREGWVRKTCSSLEYPNFKREKTVSLPDHLAGELPKFSGWVQYLNTIELKAGKQTILEITEAYEGVELFVNDKSAGVQITPIYRFDITNLIVNGSNKIEIQVSTTLERERAAAHNRGIVEHLQATKEKAPTGIVGEVYIYQV